MIRHYCGIWLVSQIPFITVIGHYNCWIIYFGLVPNYKLALSINCTEIYKNGGMAV